MSRRKAETDRISDLLTAETNGEVKGVAKVARNLKSMNMSIDDIIRATGLTMHEIESL
jgi:predicted amidophosphoribosyltransferase